MFSCETLLIVDLILAYIRNQISACLYDSRDGNSMLALHDANAAQVLLYSLTADHTVTAVAQLSALHVVRAICTRPTIYDLLIFSSAGIQCCSAGSSPYLSINDDTANAIQSVQASRNASVDVTTASGQQYRLSTACYPTADIVLRCFEAFSLVLPETAAFQPLYSAWLNEKRESKGDDLAAFQSIIIAVFEPAISTRSVVADEPSQNRLPASFWQDLLITRQNDRALDHLLSGSNPSAPASKIPAGDHVEDRYLSAILTALHLLAEDCQLCPQTWQHASWLSATIAQIAKSCDMTAWVEYYARLGIVHSGQAIGMPEHLRLTLLSPLPTRSTTY